MAGFDQPNHFVATCKLPGDRDEVMAVRCRRCRSCSSEGETPSLVCRCAGGCCVCASIHLCTVVDKARVDLPLWYCISLTFCGVKFIFVGYTTPLSDEQ